jgi:beta-galactosidase
VGWDQLELAATRRKVRWSSSASSDLKTTESKTRLRIEAGDLRFTLNTTTGRLCGIRQDGLELLTSPLRLNLWRAATDNDGLKLWTGQENKPIGRWMAAGLHELRGEMRTCEVRKSTRSMVELTIVEELFGTARSPAFRHESILTFRSDGQLQTRHTVTPLLSDLPDLPRIGLELGLTASVGQLDWYGRGPWDNYPDRKASARLGHFTSTVADQRLAYVMPQEYGLHCDTRWVSLGDEHRTRLAVTAPRTFGFSARPFSDADLFAGTHASDLPAEDTHWLYLDHAHRGIGTNSCGPDTLPAYILKPKTTRFGFDFHFNPTSLNS